MQKEHHNFQWRKFSAWHHYRRHRFSNSKVFIESNFYTLGGNNIYIHTCFLIEYQNINYRFKTYLFTQLNKWNFHRAKYQAMFKKLWNARITYSISTFECQQVGNMKTPMCHLIQPTETIPQLSLTAIFLTDKQVRSLSNNWWCSEIF